MRYSIPHYTRRSHATLLSVLAICALTGCWEEVYYDESDAGAGKSETVAASSEHSDTAASPAERSDSLSEMALAEAGRSGPPTTDAGSEADRPDSDAATTPADEPPASPAESPSDLPPDEPAATADSSPPSDEQPPQPPEGASTTVDDLFGPPVTSAEPTPPPAAVDQPTSPPTEARRPSTRRLAWLLGSKWSLSALARDRGAPREEVEKWFDQSRILARELGVTLPNLPEPAPSDDGSPADVAAIDYLFEQGQQVGRELARRYGPDHAALLEMAVKSNILLVLYEPGASATDAISSAITGAASRAGIPAELFEPLLTALADEAPRADVSQAVFRLHDAVDRFLAAPTP
jgi:hypothetical protein